MPSLEAVAFDLYGTLLALDDPLLHRQVPRLLGVSGRRWVELVRRDLLTTAFRDTRHLAEFVCLSLAGAGGERLVEACAGAVERELASARPFDGVLPMMHFLKQRGLKLGLVSNVSSAHTEPVVRFGLDGLFDAMLFSCDQGCQKPDPEIYRELCRRLGVEPGAVLMVGDSLANDVLAPASLGMMTAWVAEAGEGAVLRRAADLAWSALGGSEPARPLLWQGQRLSLAGANCTVTGLRPVSQDVQGRYNLVYEVDVHEGGAPATGGSVRLMFAKRYLAPESAYVEELAYRVQACAGLPSCGAWVVEGHEPFLIMARAPGEKYRGELDPSIAHEIGRHFAFGYIFSNADLRPRNAFLTRGEGGKPTLTMVDLEHCFFNLAIDVTSLPDPTAPEALDSLEPTTLRSLTKKRVLTERTLPRARSEFFDVRTARPEVIRAYGEGFIAAYRELKRRADSICGLIGRRIDQRPPLVIGTRAYRRAMAHFDLEDIEGRLTADPGPILEQLLATRG